MKIKIHNSMLKQQDYFRFIFNGKIMFHTRDSAENTVIYLRHRINDSYAFIHFSPITKTFEKTSGFGFKQRFENIDWWKDRECREMSE